MNGRVVAVCLLAGGGMAWGQVLPPTRVLLEGGAVSQIRNNASVPGDGTRFSYRDLLGKSKSFGRITVLFGPEERAGYRLVIAPLTLRGEGTFAKPVVFDGATFAAGVPTKGSYTFNSYRFSWWRRWHQDATTTWRGGWTVKVRDANVSLSQAGLHRSFSNLGPVPLFHLDGDIKLGGKWMALVDFDGLLAPMGGALDLGVQLAYPVNDRTSLVAGFRGLDGGADGKSVYTFATFTYLSLGLLIRI